MLQTYDNAGIVQNFVYGANRIRYSGAENCYYIYDGLGSVAGLVDAGGNLVESYRYQEFGAPTAWDPGRVNSFGFTGEDYDADTGLVYLRARYYSPVLGRFIQAEGFGGELTDPRSANPYVYCRNSPLTLTDPSGKSFTLILGVLGALYGLISSIASGETDPGKIVEHVAVMGGAGAGLGLAIDTGFVVPALAGLSTWIAGNSGDLLDIVDILTSSPPSGPTEGITDSVIQPPKLSPFPPFVSRNTNTYGMKKYVGSLETPTVINPAATRNPIERGIVISNFTQSALGNLTNDTSNYLGHNAGSCTYELVEQRIKQNIFMEPNRYVNEQLRYMGR